jgi:hypothetical protein
MKIQIHSPLQVAQNLQRRPKLPPPPHLPPHSIVQDLRMKNPM